MKKSLIISIFLFGCVIFPKQSFACFTDSTYRAWGYCKTITIHHSQVSNVGSGSETYTNFPVLVSETTDSDLAAHALSSGNDILFAGTNDVTQLNHEIEHYNSSTGELEAWVQLPSISTSVDTVINMYYGNSGAPNEQNVSSTWSNGYSFVQHLPDGSSLSLTDSTGNVTSTNHNMTATAGQIDGAGSFGTGGNYETLGTTQTFGSSTTFSAWVYINSSWTNTKLGVFTNPSNDDGFLIAGSNPTLYYTFNNFSTFDGMVGTSAMSKSAWHYITASVTAGGHLTFYVDGVKDTADTGFNSIASETLSVVGDPNTSGHGYSSLYGNIDEVHFASAARSDDWIATEFTNQKTPSSFYAVSSEVVNQGASIVSAPAVIPSNHSGHITLSLTLSPGTIDTGWTQGTTVFSISGVAGVTKVSQNITSSTAATLVLTTGSTTGTLSVSDGLVSQNVSVSAATLSRSPTGIGVSNSTTVTLTGVNTLWTQETASGLFSVSGGTGASIGTPTVSSDTSATVSVTAGSALGTNNLTITDTSTGATTTLSVLPPTLSVAGGTIAYTPSTITLTGFDTSWTHQTASTLFSVSGGTAASISNISVSSDTSATATLNPGTTTPNPNFTLTITDNSTGRHIL